MFNKNYADFPVVGVLGGKSFEHESDTHSQEGTILGVSGVGAPRGPVDLPEAEDRAHKVLVEFWSAGVEAPSMKSGEMCSDWPETA